MYALPPHAISVKMIVPSLLTAISQADPLEPSSALAWFTSISSLAMYPEKKRVSHCWAPTLRAASKPSLLSAIAAPISSSATRLAPHDGNKPHIIASAPVACGAATEATRLKPVHASWLVGFKMAGGEKGDLTNDARSNLLIELAHATSDKERRNIRTQVATPRVARVLKQRIVCMYRTGHTQRAGRGRAANRPAHRAQ